MNEMWRYVIALNVLVLLWGIVVVFGLPLWIALVCTLLVAAALAVVFVLQRRAEKKGAEEIEQALDRQADEFSGNVRPDRQAEILEMRQQFHKELQALKRSKLGGGGISALYTLPWYMIIGPPGAGKSTALRNSGLSFPSRQGNVRGIGGTRNCDWWLANEAVILDTAGRYTIEEEDRDEWLSFLDTMRKHRRRKPVNGVILAVSVTDLGGRSEEEVEELANHLRERVDEIIERLQMVVPVYLIFTKCDLVPGFMEVFGTLRKEARGQIWGATFPLEGRNDDPGQRFTEAFDELVRVLRQRTLSALDAERRTEVRALMYQFPQQLAAIGPASWSVVCFRGTFITRPPSCAGFTPRAARKRGVP